MADDITLTVRVRDLSRGELNRLQQQMNRLRDGQRNFNRTTNEGRRNARLFGRDLASLSQNMRQMMASGTATRRELGQMNRSLTMLSQGLRNSRRAGDLTRSQFRNMSRDLSLLRAQYRLLARDGNVFDRLGSRLLLFQHRLRETRDDAHGIRRAFNRVGDWGSGGMRRAVIATGLLSAAMRKLFGWININKRWTAILIATMALLGPVAQALGALLVTVLGGAFIALGAFALRGNAEVKAAFSQMKSTVGSAVRESAAPLKDSLVAAIAQVGVAARQMQPALTQAFAATAPLVQHFTGAITDLVARSLPGITVALQNSQGAMAGFRTAMGSIGEGFGEMFRIMTQGNEEELARAWVTLGNELRNLLVSLGEFISTALNSGTATMMMIGVFRTFTGALNLVAGALKALDGISNGFFTDLADHIAGFKGLDSTVADSFENSGKSISELKKDLADVDKKIADIKKSTSNIPGPGKDIAQDKAGLNDLMQQREGILLALKAAEEGNAGAVQKEATAYRDLLKQIQSLAELNRNYLDAQSAQQKAINEAKENAGKYTNALKMNKGQLDLSTKAGQDAYDMLSRIAQTTKESTDKAIEAKAPWQQISRSWKDGYNNLVSLADGMGLSKTQAQELATTILGMPPTKEMVFKARTEDAITSLDAVIAAMQATPNSKEITVKTLSQDAVKLLEDLGFKVTQLPNGEFTVTAHTGTAKDNIGTLQAARDAIKGKSITMSAADMASGKLAIIQRMRDALTGKHITITATYRTVFETIGAAPSTTADYLRKQAERFGASGGSVGGLPKKRFASGGSVAGSVLVGPGTKTSDSLMARLSRGEFVMRAAAVDKYGPAFMRAVNEGRADIPGFAKGGKVSKRTKAERSARADAASELTISHFGRMAGFKTDEFKHDLGGFADSLRDIVGSLNHWRSVILKSTHGGVEKNLLKQLDKAGKSLIKYQKSLDKTEKSLDKAKDKLNGLRDAASSLRGSVKSGVVSATDITKAAGDDKNLTVADLMSNMTQGRDKATAFAQALKDLKKKGVSGSIIEKIAQAGIEGGGLETAGTLLTASGSEIKSLNDLQKQINKSAKSAGTTAADAMYGAGIKAAEGVVKGLTKKKKDIEKAMMNIAKAMEKAIKKALGIHSPSRVMQQVGHYTAEGFATGIQKNRKVDTAWTSMLNTPSSSTAGGTTASSGSNSGAQIIQLCIGSKVLDEIVLDSNRRTVRTHGGNVQRVYGSRTS